MKHMRWLAVVVAIGVAACGGSPKSSSSPTTPASTDAPAAAAPASSGGVLGIVELKFYNENNKLGMHLHPDGKLETLIQHSGAGKPTTEDWTPLGVLAADGTVSVDGKPVGQLLADGTFHAADGRVAPFKIDGDSLVAGGKKLSFDDSGQLMLDGSPVQQFRVEGITAPNTKRTALLIVAMSLPGDPQPAH